MSTVSSCVAVAVLPAASVATAVTVSGPSPAGATEVVQPPLASTVTAAPLTVSVEPISAVPDTVDPARRLGGVDQVVAALDRGDRHRRRRPCRPSGACVAVAVLPAASVATAVTVSGPSPAGATEVVQPPLASTVTAAPFTVSVEPISAVPDNRRPRPPPRRR